MIIEGMHFSSAFFEWAKEKNFCWICLDNQLSFEQRIILKKITRSKLRKIASGNSSEFAQNINNENVNLDFWYYALGKYLIEYSNENIYGAKLLNQDLIKNARLLVPSKIEQQKIANFLDEKSKIFDEAISKKEQLISKLELAKQSLISEVVTGKLKIVEQNFLTLLTLA